MKIQFLGATQTVTGSRYLLSFGDMKILVDCGLFQGIKNLRLKNWGTFPINPSQIDAVLLTHAHIDHSGYIPLLIKNGFKGKVFCTPATRDLSAILLPDSGYLQEEEAKFANKHGFSKHAPALPLYTEKDGEQAIESFVPVNWGQSYSISKKGSTIKINFEFHPAGHLFGAATVLVQEGGKSIAFSGDLGRSSDPITRIPKFDIGADFLVVESTYGNRQHLKTSAKEDLQKIIVETAQRKGTLIIPSFAVGRAQLVLYYIKQLQDENVIPKLPVYLNSPMALQANEVFYHHFKESKMSFDQAKAICNTATPITSIEQSKALNDRKDPIIIIAASGMATGGRVIHHLKTFVTDPKNTILFVGFQAGGTRGDAMVKGAQEIKIHGQYWPVRAQIAQIDTMSGHADANEILAWIDHFKKKPKNIFVTHGEPAASDELRRRIEEKFKTKTVVPDYLQEFEL